MKMKVALAGVVVVLFVLNALPAQATDFSGYVQATYGTHWWPTGEFPFLNWRSIAGGEAWLVLTISGIDNIGDVPLTAAIYLVKVGWLDYYDESGTLITVTDPLELAQLTHVENSGGMWNDYNVIWLGTVMPGHSKTVVDLVWIGLSDWHTLSLDVQVWYRP